MLGCGIKKRLLLSFIFLLMMVMHYACVQSISKPESEKNEILNTSIELDRFENELFFQVETNQNESQELIHNVAVELTYTGDNTHEYNGIFQLYDNGENGDIIASNGIYTLLTTADTVVLPEIEPEIIDIDIPDNFMLHDTEPDSMNISITVLGKKYNLESKVLDNNNLLTITETPINLDNSEIIIEINNDYMFKDENKLEDGICERIENQNPSPSNFIPYVKLVDSNPINEYSNQFKFKFKVPFFPLSACGGTGKAIFKIILTDLDTDSEIVLDNIELIIYGCGDTYCTSEFENTNTCPEDCQ